MDLTEVGQRTVTGVCVYSDVIEVRELIDTFRNYRSFKKQSTPRSYLSCKTLHSAF